MKTQIAQLRVGMDRVCGWKLTNWIVTLHARVGLSVAVVVGRAGEQDPRPEEVAAGLNGRGIAILDLKR